MYFCLLLSPFLFVVLLNIFPYQCLPHISWLPTNTLSFTFSWSSSCSFYSRRIYIYTPVKITRIVGWNAHKLPGIPDAKMAHLMALWFMRRHLHILTWGPLVRHPRLILQRFHLIPPQGRGSDPPPLEVMPISLLKKTSLWLSYQTPSFLSACLPACLTA